jgi:hypothetical protein
VGYAVVFWGRFQCGAIGFSAAMEEFLEFIFVQRLVDIPLQRGQFTWSNNQVWFKIDRFLLSPEWEEHYPEVAQRRLPRILSDHFPLLLDCGTQREGNKYFKFENMWLKSDGFVTSTTLVGDMSFMVCRVMRWQTS